MGAAKFRVAERDVSVDVPASYAPRSTLLPPPPSEPAAWDVPSLAPFVDAVGRPITMQMDWNDRANDDVPGSSGPHPIVAPWDWDEDRPTVPSAAVVTGRGAMA